MPRVKLATIQIPPPPPPAESGGECAVNGPYLRWCGAGFPTADYKAIVVVIEGVADESVVEWTTSFAPTDAFIVGPTDRRVAILKVIAFEAVATVTATVDGTAYPLAVNMAETSCEPT